MKIVKTKPKPLFPKGIKAEPPLLAAGRYGTDDMCRIWGAEKTFDYSLKVQGIAAKTMSKLYPDIIQKEYAEEIYSKANIENVDPNRIREIEDKTKHDVIAINTALEEKISNEAGAHINKAKTSADTTQPARALQLKESLEVIINSVENLRDILAEKSILWKDISHMDNSHLYDALPTTVGRPLAHYVENLQSNLKVLKFVYDNSVVGKWADATGNHHSATALGIDGLKLQKEYCKELKINHSVAPAQVPALEFEADITYALARTSETLNNLAKYIAWGKSDDVYIFKDNNPKKRKGSSAMPQKDAHGGNPIVEEQIMSIRNYFQGNMVTALSNCELPYARNLAASSNSRINLEDGFKFLDQGIRKFAEAIYYLGIVEENSKKRVDRSYGVTTSQQVMTYLTDKRKVENPMTRSEAHNLVAELATYSFKNRVSFTKILLSDERITSKLDKETIEKITDPYTYIGESKKIIDLVNKKCYKKKTLTK